MCSIMHNAGNPFMNPAGILGGGGGWGAEVRLSLYSYLLLCNWLLLFFYYFECMRGLLNVLSVQHTPLPETNFSQERHIKTL